MLVFSSHKYNNHKFECKSIPCIFLRYSTTQDAYKCMDSSTNLIYTSRHVLISSKLAHFLYTAPLKTLTHAHQVPLLTWLQSNSRPNHSYGPHQAISFPLKFTLAVVWDPCPSEPTNPEIISLDSSISHQLSPLRRETDDAMLTTPPSGNTYSPSSHGFVPTLHALGTVHHHFNPTINPSLMPLWPLHSWQSLSDLNPPIRSHPMNTRSMNNIFKHK